MGGGAKFGGPSFGAGPQAVGSINPGAAIQMQAARKAAQQRMARLLRKARSNPKKFKAAEEAYKEGDLATACMIYCRLAASRPANQYNKLAGQRLATIQNDARQKLAQIDERLNVGQDSERLSSGLSPASPEQASENAVQQAFFELNELVIAYRHVPVVEVEIERYIGKQKRRPAIAAVLNEPEASRLWLLGRRYEQSDQVCCAFHAYREAAEMEHAVSAKRAKKRLEELKVDAQVVASAEACKKLQECHEAFRLAEIIAMVDPQRARSYYDQIVRRAPKDSRIYQEALERIAQN